VRRSFLHRFDTSAGTVFTRIEIDSEHCDLTVKGRFGVVVLNVYLACLMAWMVVMVLVAIAHLL